MEQNLCPVDVISVCSASGELKPLRLRMPDERQEFFRMDVEEILSTREIPYIGVESTVFLCSAKAWNRRWIIELKYSMRDHTWYLLRKMHG